MAPQRDNNFGLDQYNLGLEPGMTGGNFLRVRLLVDPAFSPRLPFEVFDNISDVSLRTIDSGFLEGRIEQPSGWADEGFTGKIFFIARLFPNEHYAGPKASLAKNGLSAPQPKIASLAVSSRRLQAPERELFGN